MNIDFNLSSTDIVSFLKQKTVTLLTPLFKRILTISLVALGFLAACYKLIRHFKDKNFTLDISNKETVSLISKEIKSTNKSFSQDIQTPPTQSTQLLDSTQNNSNQDFPIQVDDLILKIFSYLNSKDLCRVNLVNKKLQQLSDRNQLWEPLCQKDFSRQNFDPSWTSLKNSELTWKEFYQHLNKTAITSTKPSGTTITGIIKNKKIVGQVEISLPDGSSFKGEWENDQPKKGILTLSNGTSYEGEFNNGKLEGQGKRTKFFNGTTTICEGEFKNNKPIGLTKITLPNLELLELTFKEDELILDKKAKAILFDGTTVEGQLNDNRLDHVTGFEHVSKSSDSSDN